MSQNLNDIQLHNINLLNDKIKYLQEELRNTQADKDFVWSLWRQLQSTKPDLTDAISVVLNREKEKSDLKDQRILKIFEIKDNKIDELLDAITAKSMETNDLKERIFNLESNLKEKNENISYLKLNIKTFEDKVSEFEQVLRNQEEMFTRRLSENENEKNMLLNKLNGVVDEVGMKEQKELNYEKIIRGLDKKINEMEDDASRAKRKAEQLTNEINDYKAKQAKFSIEIDKLLSEIHNKNETTEGLQLKFTELLKQNNLHIEYTNQQEQIIQQLKLFQTELQKSIKTQEETSNSEINLLQQMYDETCKKFEDNLLIQNKLRNELEDKCVVIKNLKKSIESKNQNDILLKNSNEMYYKNELQNVKSENEFLRKQLFERDSLINELNTCRRDSQVFLKAFDFAPRKRSKSLESCGKSPTKRYCCNSKSRSVTRKKPNYSNSKEFTHLDIVNQRLMEENLILTDQNEYNEAKLARQSSTLKQLEFEMDFKLDNLKHEYEEQLKECYTKIEILTLNLNEQININDKLRGELNLTNQDESLMKDHQDLSVRYLDLQNKYKRLCRKLRDLTKDDRSRNKRKNYRKSSPSNADSFDDFDDIESTELETMDLNDASVSFSSLTDLTCNENKNIRSSNDVSRKLKRRIYELSKRLKTLTNVQDELQLLKKESNNLKSENSILQEKLKQSKLNIDALTNEIKKENDYKEKIELQRVSEKESEEETKKQYETRIKSITQDLSKQMSNNKSLKTDFEKVSDKLKVAEEKLNHTERDNAQKRQLIEFYKKKLEESKVNTEKLQNTVEIDDLQSQIQTLNDTNEKLKVQIKSLKTRLQSVQTDKTKYEQKFLENDREIDEIKGQLNLVKSQKRQLEIDLKESKAQASNLNILMKEVEQTVESKLQSLTETNMETLDVAQEKLNDAYKRINDLECVLKKFYEALISRNLRIKKIQQCKKENPNISASNDQSLKRAMNFASNVLNLSTYELEDIMLSNSFHESTHKDFKMCDSDDFNKKLCLKWLNEFENITKNDNNMVSNLFNLFVERLNELINAEKLNQSG